MKLTEGRPEPLGVTPRDGGVDVAVFSAHASAIEFCLFDGDRETHRIRLPERSGDVFHGHVGDVPEGTRYGLRAHGPYSPREGHRFNPAKLLVDPRALAIDREFRLHPSMFGHRTDNPSLPDATDSAPAMPKAIVMPPPPVVASATMVPWSRTILYELHVRGFSKRHPGIPEALRGTFAALAQPPAIDHLLRLGVTTVEIMPSAAWIEERHLAALGLQNYWGYNPVALLAPDPRLAPGGWPEIRSAVAALAAAGIETVLDVVLNHTGEGDVLGPTLSLRGLDNASYFRLHPDDPARDVDDSGCGNTLALDRMPVLRLAMDALRAWAGFAGVHGFRFDMATTMGRRDDGFDPAAPLLVAIAQDPLLRRMKLIAEPWDVGPGGYRVGAFPQGWGEWNDRFRDGMRRFWRGDAGQLGELATRLAGSADLFAAKRRPSRSINYIVAHDGFSLADLVAYAHKHNQANGEHGQDGTDTNFSWNNGTEGASADAAITAARLRDQRGLLASLLLARGTPMLAMGSECGHSLAGNNNAYAQDNATSWLDWSATDAGLTEWVRRLIAIRHAHPALHEDRFLTGDLDVQWHAADGQVMRPAEWQAPPGDVLVAVLCSPAESGGTDRVAVVLNRGALPLPIVLPPLQDGHAWHLLADSAAPDAAERTIECATIPAAPRAVLVLAAQPHRPAHRPRNPGATLAQLAAASGIAREWWEVDGTRHAVTEDTMRALLAAMRLPARTAGEIADSLARLAEQRDLRSLPQALVRQAGHPIEFTLPLSGTRPPWLTIEREDGTALHLRPNDATLHVFNAIDGRTLRGCAVSLPDLPIGRHRLVLDDAPDQPCHLTVAPSACHLPAAFAEGKTLFGVATQLYSLRRHGDQGIGDFTTLGALAEASAREGARTIGLNPLHALFPTQRERASPYQPSDRRFLDPIYLDIAPMQPGTDAAALSAAAMVDYPSVWSLKRAVLERQFAALSGAPAPDFAAFLRDGGTALQQFATFQAIAETQPGLPWQNWPLALRDTASPDVARFAEAHVAQLRFYCYLQFLCERQFSAASKRAHAAGLSLGFLRDLAVGCAPDGAEAWAGAESFGQEVSIGAPPDPFAREGQIWSLPPPDPHRMADGGYAAFAALLASNMRHAGGLRIDHVMGLARLFWVPAGGRGADGAYVSYPLADLLGQVALESARAGCMVVGEDLGTVPEGLRESLSAAGILSYRVLLLERDGIGFRPPASYPRHAVACVTTHDLPPLAGWWEAADVAERAALGLAPVEADRAAEKAALRAALAGEGLTLADPGAASDVAVAAHEFVARAPSDLMLVQADDLAGERVCVNMPGTSAERPNWRRKLSVPVEQLFRTAPAAAMLRAVNRKRAPE